MSDERRRFRDLLARYYPREVDQRRVADDARLNTARILFDPSAINSWSAILKEAEHTSRTRELAGIVASEYADTDLAVAANAYAGAPAPAPVPVATGSTMPLVQLLIRLFTLDELRMFVSGHARDVVASIAWETSIRMVAFELVNALERLGGVDRKLFDALATARPGRKAEIVEVAAGLGIRM